MEKEISVAMILYTSGLEYDDRIRKEILTLQKNLPQVKFKIFAIVPENKEKDGITGYGVPYHIPYLKSRDKYKSGTNTFRKAVDFYRTVKRLVSNFDIIWCADIETSLFPLLMPRSKKLVWDLHELPEQFMYRGLLRRIFKYMEGKCNVIYHANQPRIDCLKKLNVIKDYDKHIAIRNYPEKYDTPLLQADGLFDEFIKWKGDRACFYIQGINNADRKAYQTMKAIMEYPDVCGVVVGNIDKEALDKIKGEYPSNKIDNKLFFTSKVPQQRTRSYISQCVAAVVLYTTATANNKYCEPNRMFQTIMMGLPVIVGNNPPMADIVGKYGFGIVLDDDGSDFEKIKTAMGQLFQKYPEYKENILAHRENLCWDAQERLLTESFKNYVLK